MTTKEKLESRRFVIKSSIQAISIQKAKKDGIMELCKYVGAALDVSTQTIYNYTQGRVSDGYLAEAILAEMKLYKPKTK